MKPATKIFLSCLIILVSTFCVAMLLLSNTNVVLIVYNPVTNITTQYKVESGKNLSEVLQVPSIEDYTFVNYYNSTNFAKEISCDLSITNNTTLVLGYSKTIENVSEATSSVVGVKYVGQLSSQDLTVLLGKNYKYLDLSLAESSGNFTPYNTSLKTLILPQGNISNINNYTSLQTVKCVGISNIENSFNNCPMLCNVDLSGCEQINTSFNNCAQLKTFTIHPSLKSLKNSFVNTHLNSITNNSNHFFIENEVLYSVENSDVVAKKAIDSLETLTLNSNTTKIDQYAFYKHGNINSATINAKVSTIGEESFYGSKITELKIFQNNVLTIEKNAFRNCNKLELVDFGKGIETIGEFAFYGTAIKQLNFENSVLSKVQSYAFSDCKNLQSVKFLDKQITLEKGVFSSCDTLNEVSNLNTTALPEKVFENCKKLTSFVNISNVKNVGNYAFFNCLSLSNITELATVENLGIGVFENCIALAEAKFLNLENISEKLFLNCTELTTFVSAQNILNFNPSAFDGCHNLKNLSFVSTTFINENGVVYNADQTQLIYYLPTKTDTIFTLKNTIESLNTKYLSANNYLQEIKTENLKFKVESGVLFSADGETLLCYPSGKTNSEYIIPDYVKIIAQYSFVHSPNLTKLTIGSGVQEIKNGFMWQNNNLVTLTVDFIGESINNLSSGFLGWFFGANSFDENSQFVPAKLTEIVVSGQTYFMEKCFYDCNNLLTIKIQNSGEISQGMFYNCYALQTLTISSPLITIQDYALYNCKNLISINLCYNPNLAIADITNESLLNTPKSVMVTIYCSEQISAAQFNSFKMCFKEKRYDWNWKTAVNKQ